MDASRSNRCNLYTSLDRPATNLTPLKEDLKSPLFLCLGTGQPELTAHPITNKIKNLNKTLKENLYKDKEDQNIDNKDIDLPVPPRLVTSLLLPLRIQVLQGLPWS